MEIKLKTGITDWKIAKHNQVSWFIVFK